MNTRRKKKDPSFLPSALLVFVLGVFFATSSLASVVGVRISSVATDGDTGEATFDLTVFDTDNPAENALGGLLDRTIAATYTTLFADYYGLGSVSYRVVLGARSDWNTYPHPALVFGDGDTLPSATLPLQGTTSISGNSLFGYRLGALSHTYASEGAYTLRATVGPDGGSLPGLGPASTVDVVTGNPITGDLANSFAVYRIVYPTSAPATPVYSYAATTLLAYPNTLRYITAQQDLTIAGGPPPGGGGYDIDVPTLGTWAMIALAALLAGSGLLLLRRR